jgi:uncharacterized protein
VRATAGIPFALLALFMAGCSSPDPKIFTLDPVAGPTLTRPPLTVEVRRPGLAGYLDRSSIVTQNNGYRLDFDSATRWGEPLGDMIGRVLAQDLAQRLQGSSVFAEGGAISADADVRVELDVQRFDRAEDGIVHLDAELAIDQGSGHRRISARPISLHAPAGGNGAASLAAAMSLLLGKVADQVAQDIALRAQQG